MRTTMFMSVAALALGVLSAAPSWAQDQTKLMMKNSSEYGDYVTDGKGMSLYMFEADSQGGGSSQAKSTCKGYCATVWPPLIVQDPAQAGGDKVQADRIGTVERDDGTMQVTYGGWPVYYYNKDQNPGDTNGQDVDSFGAEWYLVAPSGDKIEE